MSRATSFARLAAAYGKHQVRRRFQRPRPELAGLLEVYAPDHVQPLTARERSVLPAGSKCILCGACALAARRYGAVRLPDLAGGHLRSWDLLPGAGSDLTGEEPDLVAAAAACPVGVPLREVAEIVARLSRSEA